jgi:D-beta-D-heptose 7-phosphate kinase/D-beta-D-heptose 1-phosphate adenosyltransferase
MAANVKDNLEALGLDVDFLTGGVRSIKKRFIDERSKQHILRVDEDKPNPPFNAWRNSLAYNQYDAIVISDYDKGFITYENVRAVREQFKGPIFIDSKKKDLAQFEGCYVKINELERSLAISICSDIITTLGAAGAEYNNKKFAAPLVEVVDVCGAGDTFLAALAYKFLETNNINAAIEYAIQAGSLTVQHSGNYAPTLKEIENARY